jgi:hypothetical protein
VGIDRRPSVISEGIEMIAGGRIARRPTCLRTGEEVTRRFRSDMHF